MRFFGKVGFSITDTVPPSSGIVEEHIVEKPYYGDITKKFVKWESDEAINNTISLNNQFSIVADAFAYKNIGAMRYVEYQDCLWKIVSADVERPRIILTIGGIYNA